MKSEILIAIKQLAAEKNLTEEAVFQIMEAALASAYKKQNLGAGIVTVVIDRNTGTEHVYVHKTVAESVTDPRSEISLEEACRFNPNAQFEDVIEVPASIRDAGRIAAQTAKQVLLQREREAQAEQVYEEFSAREGDIISGVVQRIEAKQVVMDLGRADAILPASEQPTTERYRPGQRLKAYLLEVHRTPRGTHLIASRTHKNLVRRLFELEVPEIHKGVVEIKAIAREPGYRSKVAVASRQEGVDAVGACVGLRGIRIQNVVNELGGERIDVIQWDAEPARLVANALSPAQALSVAINGEEKTATVVVPDRQLSLAIGKEGQNARLAAKLTGWRIDIKSQSVTDAAAKPEAAIAHSEEAAPAQMPAALEPIPATTWAPEEIAVGALEVEAIPALVVASEAAATAVPTPAALERGATPVRRPTGIRFAEEVLTTPAPGAVKGRRAKAGKRPLREEGAEAEGKARGVRARKPARQQDLLEEEIGDDVI